MIFTILFSKCVLHKAHTQAGLILSTHLPIISSGLFQNLHPNFKKKTLLFFSNIHYYHVPIRDRSVPMVRPPDAWVIHNYNCLGGNFNSNQSTNPFDTNRPKITTAFELKFTLLVEYIDILQIGYPQNHETNDWL